MALNLVRCRERHRQFNGAFPRGSSRRLRVETHHDMGQRTRKAPARPSGALIASSQRPADWRPPPRWAFLDSRSSPGYQELSLARFAKTALSGIGHSPGRLRHRPGPERSVDRSWLSQRLHPLLAYFCRLLTDIFCGKRTARISDVSHGLMWELALPLGESSPHARLQTKPT